MIEHEPKPAEEARAVEQTPESPIPPPVPRTGQQRFDRVKAVMMDEGIDFIAARIRLAPGTVMQGWFEPDIVTMDIRTGQPLQRG